MRRHVLKIVLGFAISLALLYLAVDDVQWDKVWLACLTADPWGLMAGTALFLGSWYVAAARWKMLLDPAPAVSVSEAFAYISIGFLANTVLPLRMGDLVRATLLGNRKGLPVTRVVGTLAVERMMDVLALLLIVAPLALMIRFPPAVRKGIGGMVLVALVACSGVLLMAFTPGRLHWLESIFQAWLPNRLAGWLMGAVQGFCNGLGVMRRGRDLLAVAGLSLLGWGLAGWSMWVWAMAYGLSIPWQAGFFVLVVINLGSAVPSSPGYVGVYHYLAILALSPWISDKESALAFALGTHAINMIANLALGGMFLIKEGLSFHALQGSEVKSGHPR